MWTPGARRELFLLFAIFARFGHFLGRYPTAYVLVGHAWSSAWLDYPYAALLTGVKTSRALVIIVFFSLQKVCYQYGFDD